MSPNEAFQTAMDVDEAVQPSQLHQSPRAPPVLHTSLVSLPDGVLDTLLQHLSLPSLRNLRTTCCSFCKLVDSRKLRTLSLVDRDEQTQLNKLLPPLSATASWSALRRRCYSHVTSLHVECAPTSLMTAYLLAAAPTLHNLQSISITGSQSLAALVLAVIGGHATGTSAAVGNVEPFLSIGSSSSGGSSSNSITAACARVLPAVHIITFLCGQDPLTQQSRGRVKADGKESKDADALMRLCSRFAVSLQHLQFSDWHTSVTNPAPRITSGLNCFAGTLTLLTADVLPACLAALTQLRTLQLNVLRVSELDADAYTGLSCLTCLQSLILPSRPMPDMPTEEVLLLGDFEYETQAEQTSLLVGHLPASLTSLLILPGGLPGELGVPLRHITRLTRLQRLTVAGGRLSIAVITQLTALTFLRMYQVHDDDMEEQAPGGLPWDPVPCLPSLQRLEFSFILYLGVSLPQLFPSLTALIAHDGAGFTVMDDSTQSLWSIGALSALRMLSLPPVLLYPTVAAACPAVTDLCIICSDLDTYSSRELAEELQMLLSAMGGITCLRLDSSTYIDMAVSEALLGLIPIHASAVTHLELAMPVSTAGLMSLLQCERLATLDISDEYLMRRALAAITSADLMVLASIPSLRRLLLRHCSHISKADCEEVLAGCGRQGQLSIDCLPDTDRKFWEI